MSKPTGGVARQHAPSLKAKTLFALQHLGVLLICCWLLNSGFTRIGAAFGTNWQPSDPARGMLLLACTLLYFARHLLTLFYLLARQVRLSEVIGLTLFFAIFEIGFLSLGAGIFDTAPAPFGWLDILAILLLLGGSWTNSYSELQRKWWKAAPENNGKCYTKGLFSHAVHINFFGDTLLFTGWALLAHSLLALAIPAFITASFLLFHIAALDGYLSQRYGKMFDDYAAKTKSFMPRVY